jgi:tetratricopeptide (TPR) repeat protein
MSGDVLVERRQGSVVAEIHKAPGRAVILSAFFTVNSFSLFICSLQRRGFRAAVCYALALASFTGGLLSKESAAMLPAVLLSYTFFIAPKPKRYASLVPFFLLLGGYVFLRLSLGFVATYSWGSAHELMFGFVSFLRGCLTYLRLMVWPTGLHFDRAQILFSSYRDPQVWATLLIFVVSGLILFKYRKGISGPVWFFLSWFWIELAPVSQVVTTIGVGPGYISTAEHFLYTPSTGVFVLMVLAVQTLYRRHQRSTVFSPDFCRAGLAGIILALMLVTVYQNIHARSALTMFERTLVYNPRNTRILYSMGLEMAERGRYPEAEHYFRRALELDPFAMKTRHALGRTLFDQGRFMDSIAEYEVVQRSGASDDLLERNLNEAYGRAIGYWEGQAARYPDNARLQYSLGTLYSRVRQIEKSIEYYHRAVALDPRQKEALFNLASSYEALGQPEKAADYYGRVVALDGPKGYLDRYAYTRLGQMRERQGQEAEAKGYFAKAEELGENQR